MTWRRRLGHAALTLAAAAAAIGVGGCAADGPPGGGTSPPSLAAVTGYQSAVDTAVHNHLRVWIEADLVKRWQDGPAWFHAALARVALLANQPGVAGVKIADELGYHDGMDSASKIRQFLGDTARALRTAAPGKLILADMVVPELGCLPGSRLAGPGAASCAAAARARYPQLALPEVDGYLRMHAIDVLDLSTGLRSDGTYAAWGTTVEAAQQAAWQEVARLGWPGRVRLQSRKALAHPGRYAGTPAQTAEDLRTFIDIPLAYGARAVDIWTWRQRYKGQIYRLMNPGLRPNPLWTALKQRRQAHDVLFTHLSPHSVESGMSADLATMATVFTDVFLPAGVG